jgi:serine/threonine-protein kinase
MVASLGKSWPGLYGGRDEWPTTAPVGRFAAGASPFGALDMTGNVWEWTASGHSADYTAVRTSDRRVVRGGGWARDLPAVVRAANRSWYGPTVRISDLGFRCAAGS